MKPRRTLRNIVSAIVVVSILLQTASCGFILYPERKGQTQGRIDPGVAILDAILLLPGIIPGIIAFAVDFVTGTIYLPRGKGHADVIEIIKHKQPIEKELVLRGVDLRALERIISEKTGKKVHLEAENIKLFRMDDPDYIERYFVKM